jgi:hypothetical protein
MDGFAFVRCTCYEENALIGCPVPYESLYIDGDGWLWSDVFNGHYDIFCDWIDKPCVHKEGLLFKAQLYASSVVAEFQEVFEEAGVRYHGYETDGYYLADDAARARDEALRREQQLPEDERLIFKEEEATYEKENLWGSATWWYDHVALSYVKKLADAAIETGHPIWFHFA